MAPLIARALAKYGVDAFDWDVLGSTGDFDEANDLKTYYVDFHHACAPGGYNLNASRSGRCTTT